MGPYTTTAMPQGVGFIHWNLASCISTIVRTWKGSVLYRSRPLPGRQSSIGLSRFVCLHLRKCSSRAPIANRVQHIWDRDDHVYELSQCEEAGAIFHASHCRARATYSSPSWRSQTRGRLLRLKSDTSMNPANIIMELCNFKRPARPVVTLTWTRLDIVSVTTKASAI